MSYPLIQVSMPWYLIGETRVERESGKYRVPRWGTPFFRVPLGRNGASIGPSVGTAAGLLTP